MSRPVGTISGGCSGCVSGETADDPLYVPAIKQVRDSLDVSGLLYVGDSKMAALATRAASVVSMRFRYPWLVPLP